jgi:hypothetical protein
MRVDQPEADVSMPEGLLYAAHNTWLESCKKVRISALHRDVARLLTDINIPHTIEQLTEDQLFSVDIALPGVSSSCSHCVAGCYVECLFSVIHLGTESQEYSEAEIRVVIGVPGTAEEKIAIEVDGPHHFTANTLQVTGEMLARQKLLNARGWAVISVPFFRWSGKTDTERIEWFQPVCHTIVIHPSS